MASVYTKNNHTKKGKTFFVSLLVSIIGILIMDIGVGILIKTNIGVDAFNVFITGISNKLNIDVGISTFIVNLLLFIMVIIIDKKKLGVATILELFLCDLAIDIGYKIGPMCNNTFAQISMCIISILMISLGVAILMINDNGLCIYDALSSGISEKYHINYMFVRYILDGLYLLSGILLNGQIGIGTIICYLLGYTKLVV